VSGDGGKRPTRGDFGPATILNLYRIAHSVDKWITRLAPNCERAAQLRQAAGAVAQGLIGGARAYLKIGRIVRCLFKLLHCRMFNFEHPCGSFTVQFYTVSIRK
jgi:hypothetical protein